MAKDEQTNHTLDSRTLQRIENLIQNKINAGYTAPCGWLFRRFTFFFFANDASTEENDSSFNTDDMRLQLARNTARFGGANIATSLESSDVTHVIINPEKLSSGDVASLREFLAARPGTKLPYLVSVAWVEESWTNGTLLDEESKLQFDPSLNPFQKSLIMRMGSNLYIT